MRIFILACLVALFNTPKAQDFRNISWDDLVVSFDFEDPFLELDSEQLYNLSLVARIREKEANPEMEVNTREMAEKDSLELWLADEHVDVDYLLAMRYKIKELRQKQFEAVDTSLNKTHVKIPGYLLPLNYDEGKTNEFLLVPWVGACIHTPPPPQNQIIYIQTNEGLSPVSRFEAVSIEGMIRTVEKSSTLYLVDGSDQITSGYSILDAKISSYEH